LKKTTWRFFATAWWVLPVLPVAATPGDEARSTSCKDCAAWNSTQAPFRIYGSTYYVGKIAASIRALGFCVEDVKLILNSHVHFDHAGGIAGLQRLSGAEVAAGAASAKVLKSGRSGPDDPQFGGLPAIPRVNRVQAIKDGETLRIGPLEVTAHLTPGHTAGGRVGRGNRARRRAACISPTWTAERRCQAILSSSRAMRPIPTCSKTSNGVFATVRALPCDILLTPHPEASDLWSRLERRGHGDADALVDATACRHVADAARERLQERVVVVVKESSEQGSAAKGT
jgi:metallo-beta-lactamase class B